MSILSVFKSLFASFCVLFSRTIVDIEGFTIWCSALNCDGICPTIKSRFICRQWSVFYSFFLGVIRMQSNANSVASLDLYLDVFPS